MSESPIRVEHNLTGRGREFEPILLAATSFSMSNILAETLRTKGTELMIFNDSVTVVEPVVSVPIMAIKSGLDKVFLILSF